jgi:hypothetical protein
MSFFRQPKAPAPVTPPNPADTENRVNDERKRRLAAGGRNATALTMMTTTGSSGTAARTSPNTLTGLNG